VQLTSDGQLIVMHDDSLERTSNVSERFPSLSPWRVRDLTLEQIKSLDCGSWYSRDDPFGQVKSGHVPAETLESFSGEPAPSLAEALEFTAGNDWRVNVELKDAGDDTSGRLLVQQAARCIPVAVSLDRVLVSSFNHDYLRWMRELCPSLPTAALTVWPMRRAVHYLAELDAQAHHPMYSSVRRRTVRQLAQHGLATNVWTVNRRSAMRRLIRLRVSGIITDFPQVLREELALASDR